MFFLLYQYLINCSSIALPGIGTLQFVDSPAQTIANGQIIAPKRTVALVNDNVNENEPKLIGFLSKQLDMSETQAHTLFEHFLQTIKTAIAEQQSIVWDNLGTFKKDAAGSFQFIQSEELDNYLPPVEASWISNHDVSKYDILVGESETNNLAINGEEPDSSKDKKNHWWWIWAIIIGAIALVVIAVKYAY